MTPITSCLRYHSAAQVHARSREDLVAGGGERSDQTDSEGAIAESTGSRHDERMVWSVRIVAALCSDALTKNMCPAFVRLTRAGLRLIARHCDGRCCSFC